MTCIENIFICMASPLLVAALCMGRRRLRFFLFGVAGMGVCLLSAYINTFLAAVYQADALAATVEIAPVVEEVMKLLPLVFYLLVFEPEAERIKPAAITAALSFATFENVCYLIQNGAGRFSFIFFRGFGTGAMHVLCGLIVGGGLTYAWQRTWLKIAGTCGLLGAAITLHAIYNLLIAYGGTAQYIAYVLPVLLITAGKLRIFRSLGGCRLACAASAFCYARKKAFCVRCQGHMGAWQLTLMLRRITNRYGDQRRRHPRRRGYKGRSDRPMSSGRSRRSAGARPAFEAT